MSMDDDLQGVLRHLKMGGGKNVNEMLAVLILNVQVSTLKRLRSMIDKNIAALTKSKSGGLDPYEILGVRSDASRDEITKAFRQKPAKAHPDKGGTDMEMIKINAAYEAIKQVRGWK